MITYCQFCGREIPENRHRRNARTCSPECLKEYKLARRLERNLRVCRRCGRPKPQPKGQKRAGEPGNRIPGLFAEPPEKEKTT